jgi:hypothetical protein
MASTPTILLINGLNFIPSPSITAFETEFAGILPQGTSIPSSWCVTGFYDFSPDASSSSRRANLVHEIGTSYIGMVPLALRLKPSGSHVINYDL